MNKPAVFLDRDGTINEQMGYLNHVSRLRLLPGAAEAIRWLNEHGYLVIVLTNQSGVARGYFPIDLVHEVHERMESLLGAQGARIDGIFFCPHYPGGSVPEYGISCACRKPGTGMLDQACAAFEIERSASWMIGDTCQDVEMAHRAGIRAILVETGYGMGERSYTLPGRPHQPVHIAADLPAAVHWILGAS